MSTNLKTLIAEFSRWQQEGNRGQVPKYFKDQIIELCKHHSPSYLANCLGLKTPTVKQWCRRASHTKQSAQSNSLDFVTIAPTLQSNVKIEVATSVIHFELSHNIKLFISGQNKLELVELASDLAKRLTA